MIKEELTVLTLPYPGYREVTVRVFVPEHEEGEKLPVVYMTDGQNLFDETPQMYGCWHTREAVRVERERSGKAAIIVGIHNDGHPAERTNDLMPRSIGGLFFPPEMPKEIKEMIDPQGEVFDGFVVNTVIPAIQERFPVKAGAKFTAFCGSSSGGLQAFYTGLSHAALFGTVGAFSPCLMIYYPEELERWIRDSVSGDSPYLYLYSGGAPGLEEQTCQCVKWANDILRTCYPAERLHTVIKPEQPHHESAWDIEFRDFLHLFLN